MSAFLVLEDGTVHRGRPYGGHGIAVGEVVFTTAMTGYQEVVTDPSFAGQLVTFTQPTEPGTLKASVRVDFKPGAPATYCAPYFPPGLAITLTPRS